MGRKILIWRDVGGFQKPSPLGKVARVAGRKRSPHVPPRASDMIDVVSATRTSSVFGKTMQAFFAESTFPRGEGYFWTLRQLPDKSEYGELNTSEVIITDERVQHIREHHPADYGLFEKYGKKTIEAPDIIIRDIKNESTAFLVLKLDEINLNMIVRLSVANTDSSEHKNPVMTFYRIRTKILKSSWPGMKCFTKGKKSGIFQMEGSSK